MANLIPISVTMLVKNSQRYLSNVLTALQDFDEVLLLDNGSTDQTLDIATKFPNVVIHRHHFIGFGPMKNLAAELAKHDWIINIDSDEVFPKALVEEIRQLDLSETHKVYAMLRLNHYRGKIIKTCGWYPDYVTRLYHKQHIHFNQRQVHESLEISALTKTIKLKHSFLHYSFANAEELIAKMQQYSSLFATQHRFKRHSSILSAIGHGIAAFFKHYFSQYGFLDGRDGFVIASANAMGSYYKYVKLQEANQALTCALVITTYNRPDALTAVLQSVLAQTQLPDQVVIADDGSDERTQQVIHAFQQHFPIPLVHAWQEDDGFKLAQSRNQALARVNCDYVVVIDGDMLLHPEFIADHKRNATLGVFVQGGRVILPQAKTVELLAEPITYRPLKWYEKGIERRLEKRFSACHLPWLNRLLSKKIHHRYKGIRGCNMGFFLSDAKAINGFNNDFVGWGREDSEFVARLYNNGVTRKNIRFSAIAYHLYHHEAQRDALPENDLRLKQAIDEKLTWYDNGLQQIKETYTNHDNSTV